MDSKLKKFQSEIQRWQQKIEIANRNNIFCHCLQCDREWVDSSLEAICTSCGSNKVERIACWQFPDD
jgi:Zn finger protein HypA/HybF involved in hydrogenase expression